MDTSSPPTRRSDKDAPLELLPLEIKVMIVENLCRPDALTLKFCSPTFYHATVARTRQLIPPYTYGREPDLERDPYFNKWIHRPLACRLCGRLRPSYKFTDKMKRGDIERLKRKILIRNKALRGPKPKAIQTTSRFCVDCGTTPDAMGHQQYGRGTWLRIGGLSHIVCVQCNKVDLSDKRKEKLCRGCWEKKLDTEPEVLAIRPLPQRVVEECRLQGNRTSHGTIHDGADVTGAAHAASDPKHFPAKTAYAHNAKISPAKTANGIDVMKKVYTKKAAIENGISRDSKFQHNSRIEKNPANPRSTTNTTNPRKLKRSKGDWKPKLPPWHNITLVPFPATRVVINSDNAVSSEAFTTNISSVHVVPTVANAALSDAQLWGKMMLNARIMDQSYVKHKLGWNSGHQDVEMEDESCENDIKDENSEEQISDEDGGVEIEDEYNEDTIKDENSENQNSDEAGGVEISDDDGGVKISDANDEEQFSDDDGGVKITDTNDEPDIQNQLPKPGRTSDARKVDVTDTAF